MKIYISGAISGTDDYMERFDAAETALMAEGDEIINPAKVNASLPPSTTQAEYMRLCIIMLEMCDMIFVLKNWEHSKGCKQEIEYAKLHGIPILFEPVEKSNNESTKNLCI